MSLQFSFIDLERQTVTHSAPQQSEPFLHLFYFILSITTMEKTIIEEAVKSYVQPIKTGIDWYSDETGSNYCKTVKLKYPPKMEMRAWKIALIRGDVPWNSLTSEHPLTMKMYISPEEYRAIRAIPMKRYLSKKGYNWKKLVKDWRTGMYGPFKMMYLEWIPSVHDMKTYVPPEVVRFLEIIDPFYGKKMKKIRLLLALILKRLGLDYKNIPCISSNGIIKSAELFLDNVFSKFDMETKTFDFPCQNTEFPDWLNNFSW